MYVFFIWFGFFNDKNNFEKAEKEAREIVDEYVALIEKENTFS